MPRKKKDPSAVSPSTSDQAPRLEAENSAPITSDHAASATPWSASETLSKVETDEMGDLPGLIERLKAEGVNLYLAVNGSNKTSVNAKIGEDKRTQSLPPGDLLILVLPPTPEPRRPGVYMIGVAPA